MSPSLLIGATFLWLLAVVMLYRRRRWLLFYMTGALGFTLLVAFFSQTLRLDTLLESLQAAQVTTMARAAGLDVVHLAAADLAIGGLKGWSVFNIGLECSGLLEAAVFAALVGFYPAFSPTRKTGAILLGVGATYLINIARILLIVSIISAMGTNWVFAAHALFGRVFFFTFTVLVYWLVITAPTLDVVAKRLGERA